MLDLATLPGARRSLFPQKFIPMLASLPDGNFVRQGWIYEPKMDGMRALSMVSNGSCRLMSRRALNITNQYPSLANEMASLAQCDAIFDGEIIALNELGQPSFQHLQQRMNLIRMADISRAELAVPAFYFVFDIVWADGYDLCGVKLAQRKEILHEKLKQSERVRILTVFEDDGMTAYEACVEKGFEGIVAKRLESPYEPGRRSNYWTKVKAQQTDEFVVGGFTHGQGSRAPTFGALLLGAYDENDRFIYCGSVGSGFDERLLRDMCRRMEPWKRPKHPFLKRPDEKKEVTWIEPKIVIEIKFMDWTFDSHIRSPVFLRVREDKAPEECRLEKRKPTAQVPEPRKSKPSSPLLEDFKVAESVSAYTAKKSAESSSTPKSPTKKASKTTKNNSSKKPAEVEPKTSLSSAEAIKLADEVAAQLAASKGEKGQIVVDGDMIEFTHLDKIMWPAQAGLAKVTKRDFLRYIALASPFLLNYLRDRPLSVVRSPDGMKGKRFYQKHWNFQIPDYVETFFLNNEEDEVAMCNNLASLLWFSQHSVMEHHVWLSRVTTCGEGMDCSDTPDFMVFDLDRHLQEESKEKRIYNKDSFLRVCEVAEWLREALKTVSLVPHLKTSGRNGLHIFVPIETTIAHDDVRTLAETISRFLLNKYSDKVTVDAVAAKREGKVLLDSSPNCRGKTLVAPYSPRLVQEQTVSTPLKWEELGNVLPIEFTMTTVPERLRALGDLWKEWEMERRNLETILKKK